MPETRVYGLIYMNNSSLLFYISEKLEFIRDSNLLLSIIKITVHCSH